MAKYTTTVTGDFYDFKNYLRNAILGGSISATFEDEYASTVNGVRCSVQVYERFSYSGGNRVSLSVTLIEHEGTIRVAAITSGGSQALFLKVNTWGEEAFLEKLQDAVEAYRR